MKRDLRGECSLFGIHKSCDACLGYFILSLEQGFSTQGMMFFVPQGTLRNIWRHFWLLEFGLEDVLAFSGWNAASQHMTVHSTAPRQRTQPRLSGVMMCGRRNVAWCSCAGPSHAVFGGHQRCFRLLAAIDGASVIVLLVNTCTRG